MAIPILLAFAASTALFTLILYERYFLQNFLDNFTLLLLTLTLSVSLASLASLLLLRTTRAETIRRIWLALTTTALTYAAVDLIAGWILMPPLSPALVGDETVHHRLLPDTRSAIYNRDYSYLQRVNKLGLRGPDIDTRKPAGTYRIAMLGDSFIMGKGVADDQTGAWLLEKALRRDGHRVEVLNGGVDSYAPILSLLQLRTHLVPLEPDLVMLNLDMSDLLQEQAYRHRARYDADGRLVGVDGRLDQLQLTHTQKARNWVNEHLYLSRLVVYYAQRWAHRHRGIDVASVVGMANPGVLAHTLASDRGDRDGQWQTLFTSVLAIRDECAGRGIDFTLVTYPWGHQVNAREWIPGRFAFVPDGSVISDRSLERIRAFAAQNGIALLDLFPAFRAYAGSAPLYYRFDMHWTPAGHRLYARELQRLVADRL